MAGWRQECDLYAETCASPGQTSKWLVSDRVNLPRSIIYSFAIQAKSFVHDTQDYSNCKCSACKICIAVWLKEKLAFLHYTIHFREIDAVPAGFEESIEPNNQDSKLNSWMQVFKGMGAWKQWCRRMIQNHDFKGQGCQSRKLTIKTKESIGC